MKKPKPVQWEELLLEFVELRLKDETDEVIGMVAVNDMNSEILVVAENGYGKRSSLEEYRITNRGGKGVKTLNITEKTGKLISINAVTDADDLMIINKSGLTIRMAVEDFVLWEEPLKVLS